MGVEEEADPRLTPLLARGWRWVEAPPCEGLEPATFYEIESEAESTEFYSVGPGRILSPREPPWPEPPAICRPVLEPSFVEEV